MKIHICHDSYDTTLSEALIRLLTGIRISSHDITTSNLASRAGNKNNRWLNSTMPDILQAQIVLILLSPHTNKRPWNYFEGAFSIGLAHAKAIESPSATQKVIIPVYYFMEDSEVIHQFDDIPVYSGERQGDIRSLYTMLSSLQNLPVLERSQLDGALQAYLNDIEAIRTESISATRNRYDQILFEGSFHNYELGKKMEGDWISLWTEIPHTTDEYRFKESESIRIWSTRERLIMSRSSANSKKAYLMEGLISSTGHISMYYTDPVYPENCGTAFLKLIGGHRIMKGSWMSYAPLTSTEDTTLKRGNLYLARDEELLAKITRHVVHTEETSDRGNT